MHVWVFERVPPFVRQFRAAEQLGQRSGNPLAFNLLTVFKHCLINRRITKTLITRINSASWLANAALHSETPDARE